jgi:hypothetical protein
LEKIEVAKRQEGETVLRAIPREQALSLPLPVPERGYARELDEIVNEVRLIEVAAVRGDLRPINLCRVA